MQFRLSGGGEPGDMADATRGRRWPSSPATRSPRSSDWARRSTTRRIVARIWSGHARAGQQHLDAGQRVWLVTAAPVELATIIAKRLGLTGALGTVAEIEDGVYTGRLVGEPLHGPAKAEAVRALAEREGLDLARCAAYSDSINDIPMLSLVGDAGGGQPGRRRCARARARQAGEIRDFRTGRKAARIGVPVPRAGPSRRVAVGRRGRRTAASRALSRRIAPRSRTTRRSRHP